ncbi:hypothetical protein SUDANB145_06308 [Streptomyces sp. enrichment culture]
MSNSLRFRPSSRAARLAASLLPRVAGWSAVSVACGVRIFPDMLVSPVECARTAPCAPVREKP